MPVTTAFWCERLCIGGGVWNRVLLRCDENGMLTERTRNVDPPPDAYRLPGLVFPGFANAHSHAFHRMLRGRTHTHFKSFWKWREAMYQVAGELNPDSYYQLARLVYAEMVQAGYTCVGEFHYLHHQPDGTPYADPNAMGLALIEAARDAGIRITLLDTLYLTGGLDQTGYQPLSELQLAFGDGDVATWFDRVAKLGEDDNTRIGTALHSIRAVPADALPEFAEYTKGKPVHAHLSEQPAENEACQEFHGCSPTELLSRNGVLSRHFTAVHATHVSDVDIQLLRAGDCRVCFCPTTEADLADGIGPALELFGCVGSDQHAVIDPFAELRALEYGERLRSGERGRLSPGHLVATATSGGYGSLGWDSGRFLWNGPCDLVAVRTDTPRTAGSDPDQLVMVASASDVDTVVVGGRIVVRDGRHETVDVGAGLAALIDGWWDR
ncbi:MAG TPA: formimidoylglutamate deiminase [Pseudonocardiaceae bacterium]|nr:formimidoylglutamate deiminase [Pseudonocardiaceae bacterium]